MQNAIAMLETKEERIRLAYINGIDTVEDYQLNKDLINRERKELNKRLEELENTTSGSDVDINTRVKAAATILNSKTSSNEEKSLVLKSICDKIIYDKANETLEFFFIN